AFGSCAQSLGRVSCRAAVCPGCRSTVTPAAGGGAWATSDTYSLSLHDALPIWRRRCSPDRIVGTALVSCALLPAGWFGHAAAGRSEEHTSELQSRENLVCRLLLAKKR